MLSSCLSTLHMHGACQCQTVHFFKGQRGQKVVVTWEGCREMFVVIIARISKKPAAQSSTFQHLQMVEFNVESPVSPNKPECSVDNFQMKKVWNMLRQLDESIITKQTRALPLFAVCTLCLCTLCLCALCLCTLHSPRIPSCVVASLSNGHAHCIPTNIWQLTNCSYKIFTFETWHLVKLHCNPRTLLVKPGPYHIWTWRPQLLTPFCWILGEMFYSDR